MRLGPTLFAMLALGGPAAADDGLRVGAAVGAGAQGAATYGAVELQIDAEWRGVRLGLGARGVWEGGVFRHRDWSRPASVVTIVRQLEAEHVLETDRDGRTISRIALAAGGLAPARIAHVVDGHRATLDDRLRTGARSALSTPKLELGLEIDDVLDPSLIGGGVAWQTTAPWGVHAAVGMDPRAPDLAAMTSGETRVTSAIEVGIARRWDALQRRVQIGGALVGEPAEGITAVGFGSVALERGEARWAASADVRGGNGTSGAVFGPLYRLERNGLIDRAQGGIGGGIALGVTTPAFSLAVGGRARPGLGALGTIAIAAPMSPWIQAGGWVAASRAARRALRRSGSHGRAGSRARCRSRGCTTRTLRCRRPRRGASRLGLRRRRSDRRLADAVLLDVGLRDAAIVEVALLDRQRVRYLGLEVPNLEPQRLAKVGHET